MQASWKAAPLMVQRRRGPAERSRLHTRWPPCSPPTGPGQPATSSPWASHRARPLGALPCPVCSHGCSEAKAISIPLSPLCSLKTRLHDSFYVQSGNRHLSFGYNFFGTRVSLCSWGGVTPRTGMFSPLSSPGSLHFSSLFTSQGLGFTFYKMSI